MSQLDNIQYKLSKGVNSWLEYEFTCDRGNLFNEKYLSFPIGNILNSVTDCLVLTEINHPAVKELTVGRPLQIDFILSEKGNKSSWKYAVESKWTGITEAKFDDIIWDLIRLQNIFHYQDEIKCYFVFAGFLKTIKASKISALFKKTNKDGTTFESDLIKKNSVYNKFELKHLDETTKRNINKRKEKYSDFKLYSEIVIKQPHTFPIFDLNDMTSGTGIKNMSLFASAFEVIRPNKNKGIPKIE